MGTPCRNDRKLFEYLMYEVLQCGLSWNTILLKRDAFRVAFERFDFTKIAHYGEKDIARVLAVPGMIRSRRKVEAIIHDAKCFIELRRECGTFSKWLWAFTDGKTLHNPDNAKSDVWTAPTSPDTEHFFPKKTSWNGGHLVDFRFGRPQDHLDVCTDDIESRRRDRQGHAGGAGSPTGGH